MKIIHIEHSSAYIETEEFQILLDVTNDELTSIREDKPLVIFNTHGHRDHYHPSIFGYEAKNVSVSYVIFDEIKLPMEKKENLFPMKAHQRLSLFGGKIEVETLKSTDEGLAFVIWVEGKTIYFAGDLHWWHWEGEGDDFNLPMEKAFKEEIEYLKKRVIDVAFIPLDTRLGNAYDWGMNYILDNVKIKKVIPIHQWGDYSINPVYEAKIKDQPYKAAFCPISHKGEVIYG